VVVPGEHGVLAGGGIFADFVVDVGEDGLVVLVDEGPGRGGGEGGVALGRGGVEAALEVGYACVEVAFDGVELAI
jgi:hypothetical protein